MMKQTIDGNHYDTERAIKLAGAEWSNFPTEGDAVRYTLFKDLEGRFFVVEESTWMPEGVIVPKTRKDAELFYLIYAHQIFEAF